MPIFNITILLDFSPEKLGKIYFWEELEFVEYEVRSQIFKSSTIFDEIAIFSFLTEKESVEKGCNVMTESETSDALAYKQ